MPQLDRPTLERRIRIARRLKRAYILWQGAQAEARLILGRREAEEFMREMADRRE